MISPDIRRFRAVAAVVICALISLLVGYSSHAGARRDAIVTLSISPQTIAVLLQSGKDTGQPEYRSIQLPASSSTSDWRVTISNPKDQAHAVYILSIAADGQRLDIGELARGTSLQRLLHS